MGNVVERFALPPPMYGSASLSSSKPYRSSSFQQSVPPYRGDNSNPVGTAPPVTSSAFDNQVTFYLKFPKEIVLSAFPLFPLNSALQVIFGEFVL